MIADELTRARDRIEELDREILRCIAERTELARHIGDLKQKLGSATLDPEREATVIRRAVATARSLRLPEEPVRDLFWTLLELARNAQLDRR